ncbi:MAG TPA: DUF362 domain-containing protein [Candidatus Ozemobacteraceae bacterium]|mgnify:CR=1 FL=1|nr:DUF362 domain-containing protein [Candidatus Ozemobacteraceae bacterium]
MKRRDFLKMAAGAAAAVSLGSVVSRSSALFAQEAATFPPSVWVEGGEPAALLKAALDAYGGMGRFVSAGDVVVVKPNIGWDRTPELAGNTNPDLVAEVVKACLAAGAAKVKVFDRTCNNARRTYVSSLIEEKAAEAGAEVTHVRDDGFVEHPLPNGKVLKSWPVYKEYLDATKVINVPIAKHHGMATVTLGLKNLMGVMGGSRGEIHTPFQQKVVDIAMHILPTITIIDAYRILMNHGPSGGDPADVKLTKTLVMSPCTLSADVTALPLFGHALDAIPYLKEAVSRGIAKNDIATLQPKKILLS